jgi:hypothetical protein
LKRSVINLFAVTAVCLCTMLAAGTAVVVHPEDILRVQVKGTVVEVSIGQPKANELAHKGKQGAIEFSIPAATAKGMFVCETRYSPRLATISFKFPNESAAAGFAEELKTAKAQSQCDCH